MTNFNNQYFKLLAINPIDGRYNQKTRELCQTTSEFALIKYRLFAMVNWFLFLSDNEKITELAPINSSSKKYLADLCQEFSPKMAQQIKDIEKITNHDLKAVEYFLQEEFSKKEDLKDKISFIHFASTSEDINNIAHALMIKNSLEKIIYENIQNLLAKIKSLSVETKNVPLMARTHGQAASPTTFGKELANVYQRVNIQLNKLKKIKILGKINGATGNYNAHIVAYPDVDWQKMSEEFLNKIGLDCNLFTTQIEPHDYISEIFSCVCHINNILLDFSRDIWGHIAFGHYGQKKIANEVGSSTMPHKINPIDFENAEGNLGLANAIFSHLASKLVNSRFQRDLTDSTALRNIGVGFGYSLISYKSLLKGIEKLEVNAEFAAKELEENYELLGEAVQTIMRKYKLANPYEKLKELTRGKKLTKEILDNFINELKIPDFEKQKLKELSPKKYIGIANNLAIEALKKE